MQTTTQKNPLPDEIVISPPAVTGELHLHRFESKVFRNSRFLRVWLPPGYHEEQNSQRYYPVFYLNDGQNLFEATTSFTGVEWQVDETAERLIREAKIAPMMFVGIDNGGADRAREYLPYRALNPRVFRPQGKRYPEFLLNEVMPFLYDRYRIARGPENTGLGGSSLGAIAPLFTAIDRPGIFGKLLLESPSLFVSQRRLLKYSRAFRSWPQKMFLAIGTREVGRSDKDSEAVNDVRELERILKRSGLGDDRLRVNIEEGAAHSEGDWARRFPEALTFLFGT